MTFSIIFVIIGCFIVFYLYKLQKALVQIDKIIRHKFDDGFISRFEGLYAYMVENKRIAFKLKKNGKIKKEIFDRSY